MKEQIIFHAIFWTIAALSLTGTVLIFAAIAIGALRSDPSKIENRKSKITT